MMPSTNITAHKAGLRAGAVPETVGPTSQPIWFAYLDDGTMLRDKRGVGRRFKSESSAKAAIAAAKGKFG